MKSSVAIILVALLGYSFNSQAEVLNMYQVVPGVSNPILLENLTKAEAGVTRGDTLKLRIKMTKFVITKTESGPKINFTPVCEIDSKVKVKDMSGGGLISEDVLGVCESTYKGKRFNVVMSGMIYDNEVADFSDETKDWTRNFFAHLSLEGQIITGLGDFNLDTSRDQNMTHLSSSLSVDPQFGQRAKSREGFTARIRYMK